MRRDSFLQEKLDELLEGAFADVVRPNLIHIRFGRRAKRRFGSIKMNEAGDSVITINGLFRETHIPEQIICATIAHELCHYVHGFGSPLKQRYRHPHQGGVIRKEMEARGLGKLYTFERQWTKAHWKQTLIDAFGAQAPYRQKRRVRRRRQPQSTLLKLIKHLLQP